MNLLKALQRPEYIYRPQQIIRRLTYFRIANCPYLTTTLPWGMPITVCPGETLGRAICTLGLDDLPVCEILWRLMPRAGVAVDVGANIGQMTSILSKRAGPNGKVIAIEPELRNLNFLRRNTAKWLENQDNAPISIIDCAAAECHGEISLYLPNAINANRGLASIMPRSDTMEEQRVRSAPLSTLLKDFSYIDVLKIDVENAEDRVIDGYTTALAERRVGVLLAEEHRPLPSPLTNRLSNFGYSIYGVTATMRGPQLIPLEALVRQATKQPPNVVAIRDPEPALRAMAPSGWCCLAAPRKVA